MTAIAAPLQSSPQQSDDAAAQIATPSGNAPVMIAAFVLMLITLAAGMPILALAFFGASAGSLFSMLIDYHDEIASTRASLLKNKHFGWY